MPSDATLSDLERCLSTVVSELREQYELANRLKDIRFKRAKTILLESSLSTYQWLAIERVRRQDKRLDSRRPTRKEF
jgi:hypothetical protein